jgi:hypothetical protein
MDSAGHSGNKDVELLRSTVATLRCEARSASSDQCIDGLEALADAMERVGRTFDEISLENDALRQLLAQSDAKCPYCGLASEDMAKCERGFPGCARADDEICGPYPIGDGEY